MTTESQSQLLKPSDRNEYRVEKVQDLLNKSPTPDTFEGFVYTNHNTEEPATTGPIFCRVFSPSFHDAGSTNPIDAKSRQEYNSAIQACKQGAVRSDHPNAESLTNGSIWICKKEGALVTLISLKQGSSFSFDDASGGVTGKAGGAMAAFAGKAKKPVLKVTRTAGAEIQLIARSDLQAQLDKYSHFKNFFDEFRKRLKETAFTGATIQVNSLFRNGPMQASAMIGGRFNGSASSLAGFRRWFMNTYTQGSKTVVGPKKVIFGTEWRSVAKLQKALGDQYTKQIEAGWHKNGSGHSTLKAMDINTNQQPYENVIIMLEVLKEMKSAGWVKGYNWEQVWDHKKGNPEVGLKIRRERGVFAPAEHIHLSVTAEPEAAVHAAS
jgi:putative IMPACT (imprinted ancient) family translation regulator